MLDTYHTQARQSCPDNQDIRHIDVLYQYSRRRNIQIHFHHIDLQALVSPLTLIQTHTYIIYMVDQLSLLSLRGR